MGIVQQRVYQSRVHNIDELNQRLLHVWHGIDQTIIDMQVTSCVGVIAHVCRQKADTSSNYYNNIQPYDKRRFIFVKCYTIFRLFFCCKLPQIITSKFRKIMRQHTEGMLRSIRPIWVLLEI